MKKLDYLYYLNKYDKFITNLINRHYSFISDKDYLRSQAQYCLINFLNKYKDYDEVTIDYYIKEYYYSHFFRELLNSIDDFCLYEDRVSLSLIAILKVEDRVIGPVTIERVGAYYGVSKDIMYSVLNYVYNYLEIGYEKGNQIKERELDISDDIINNIYLKNVIDKSLSKIKDSRKEVVLKRVGYYDNKKRSFQSIASDYGCAWTNIQQKNNRAKKKIKKVLSKELDKK